jgi:hypothetical protein
MIALPPDVEKKLTLLAQEAHTTVKGYLSSIVSLLPEPKLTDQGEETVSDAITAKLAAFQDEDLGISEAARQQEYALWTDIENALQGQSSSVGRQKPYLRGYY